MVTIRGLQMVPVLPCEASIYIFSAHGYKSGEYIAYVDVSKYPK